MENKVEKRDIVELLQRIREKLQSQPEAGCIFGDKPDPPIYYILPPQ